MPIESVYAAAYMVTFVTDRPGGFTDSELTDLARAGQRLSIITDRHNQWWITQTSVLFVFGGFRMPARHRRGGIHEPIANRRHISSQ